MQVDGVGISGIVASEVSWTSINDQVIVVRKLGVLCYSAGLHCYTKWYAVRSIRTKVRPVLLPLVVAGIGNTWICKGTVREFCEVCCGVEDNGALQAVLQIRAHSRKIDHDGDVEALELGARTYATEF